MKTVVTLPRRTQFETNNSVYKITKNRDNQSDYGRQFSWLPPLPSQLVTS